MSRLSQCWIALLLATLCACSTTPQQEPAPDDGNKKTSLLTQANQFAREGLLREAVDAYKKVIAKEPGNMAARRNLGIVLLKAGDPKSAITNLESAINNFEQNFETNFFLAEAYRAEDKYAEAIYRYKKSLKIKPDETRALKSLAWSYFKIRFYSEAINIATKLQKKAPNDEQALMIFARTQIKLKRENEAIKNLMRGLERASPISKPYFESVIAEAYAAQGKRQAALEMWQQALKTQPLMAGALMGLGRVLLELGRDKEAVEYLERAVRVKPKMTEGHYWLARSLQNSNPQRALRFYNAFKKNSANDPEFVELVQDARKRAASLQKSARPETNSLR